jgi:hypothetical protein
VISLAKAFQRQVIAEGVETVEHGVLLLRMGCELGQGYGIARPMPGDALASWAAGWRPDSAWISLRSALWAPEDHPLLYASIAHRHWVNRVHARLTGVSPHLRIEGPLDDMHSCAFGRWYYGRGKERYGSLDGYTGIELLHSDVHALGEELLILQESDPQAAEARLPELFVLRDRLIDALEDLRSRVGY